MDIGDVGRILVSVTRKVKKTASQIVNPLTPLEKLLKEATSNTNWGCSSTILNEISRSMVDYHDYIVVQHCICDCLSQRPSKWRKIYKALVLVEYLLKNGIERFIEDTKENVYRIRSLQDFYYSEEGKDKGAGIRDKSRYVLNLLNDPLALKNERKKAKNNRGRYIGINGRCETSVSYAAYCGDAGIHADTANHDRFSGGRVAGLSRDEYCSNRTRNCNDAFNHKKELYDPYIPQLGATNEQDNRELVVNKTKQIASDSTCYKSSLSLESVPVSLKTPSSSQPPLSLPPSGCRTSGAAARATGCNTANSVGPDKCILDAANILARRDALDDQDNQVFSPEWCDFIGASGNKDREAPGARSAGSNPFASLDREEVSGLKGCTSGDEEERVDGLGVDASEEHHQVEMNNKKRIMESLDLLSLGKQDGSSASDFSFAAREKRADEFNSIEENEDCRNYSTGYGNSNANIHIPFGF